MIETHLPLRRFLRSLPLLFALLLLALFPPWRQAGDWHEYPSGEPAPLGVAAKFDRLEFGYAPNYRWAGSSSDKVEMVPGVIVGQYECSAFQFEIDHLWLVVEGVFVAFPLAIVAAAVIWHGSHALLTGRWLRGGTLGGFFLFALGAIGLREAGVGSVFLLLLLVLPGVILQGACGFAAMISLCGSKG